MERNKLYTVKNAAGLFYTGVALASTVSATQIAGLIRVLPIGAFAVEGGMLYSRAFAMQTVDGPVQLAALLDERLSSRLVQRIPNHSREVL